MASMKYRRIIQYSKGTITGPELLTSLFGTPKPTSWTGPKPKPQSEAKKKKKQKKDNHASDSSELNAVLAKGGNYGAAFAAYIRTDQKRAKVYNTISPNIKYLYGADSPALLILFEDYFKLSSADCNFNPLASLSAGGKTVKANKQMPYSWEAHHLIPGEAFSTMKDLKGGSQKIFSDLQYSLLLMSDYDINNGHNLMALPANNMDHFQAVHNLLQHPSNHTEYTSRVMEDMKKVSKNLKKLEDKAKEDHPDVVVAISDEMFKLENNLWKLLVKLGKVTVTNKVQGGEWDLSDDDKKLIKFKAATTSTEYEYGALT